MLKEIDSRLYLTPSRYIFIKKTRKNAIIEWFDYKIPVIQLLNWKFIKVKKKKIRALCDFGFAIRELVLD